VTRGSAVPGVPRVTRRPDGQRGHVGFGSHPAGVDVLGLGAPDDVARMDELLPAQRDLIDG
jgi:hypothetical protein